jgi:hypothetical protein
MLSLLQNLRRLDSGVDMSEQSQRLGIPDNRRTEVHLKNVRIDKNTHSEY